MPQLFANNFTTTLAAGITSGATALTLASAAGLPVITTSADFFLLTLEEAGVIEIVKVTAATGTAMSTIVRAQEGTTASAFTTAAHVELRLTAGALTSLVAKTDVPTAGTGQQYFRLRFPLAYNSSGFMGITNVSVYETVGGTDFAPSATLSASATLGGFPTSNAVDGNNSTFWTTGGTGAPTGGHWFTLDFGAGVLRTIALVKLKPRVDFNEAPLSMELEVSSDNTNWSSVGSFTAIPAWTVGEERSYTTSILSVAGTLAAAVANLEAARYTTVNLLLDGHGAPLQPGVVGDLRLDTAGTIIGATLMGDRSGSLVVDLWKRSFVSGFPPTVSDKITGSTPPTLASAVSMEDTVLSGWSPTVAKGDVIRVNINSATTIQSATLALTIRKF